MRPAKRERRVECLLLLCFLVVSLFFAVSTAANASAYVTVSPLKGTPDASPSTQLSFLSDSRMRVRSVRAVGSRSGHHSGVVREYSTGDGASFLPKRQFVAGEYVAVRARVEIGKHSQVVFTSFVVGSRVVFPVPGFRNAPGDPSAVQHYATEPSLTPPKVFITTPAQAGAAPGDLFFAPEGGAGAHGAMITDQAGNLIWFHPLPSGVTPFNLSVQSYEGHPALVWWEGRVLGLGFGEGEDVVLNESYRTVATINAGNGYRADLHSVRLTPEGTAWIDAFSPVRFDNRLVTDAVIQEVDIKTGLVMWEWHALGHIGLGESKNPAPSPGYPWDYVHVNALEPSLSGNLLVSFRNTWSLVDINLRTGGVSWRLGGNHSSFKMASGAQFYWQHDAQWQPGGLISVFDDGAVPRKEEQSRGLLLKPDFKTKRVSLVNKFSSPEHALLTGSQGSMEGLPGGDWLLGYGELPNFTEFDAAGNVLLAGTLGPSVQSFKTILAPWSGHPTTPPRVMVVPGAGTITILVSWNGATEVASWRVLSGPSSSTLSPLIVAPKQGFETSVVTGGVGADVAVQALNAAGVVIGTSATIPG